MKKKLVLLVAGIVSLTGLAIAQTKPAYSATCGRVTTTLRNTVATASIPISIGLKRIPVNNQTPFTTGMRVRVTTGSTVQTTKFVEGRVGSVSNCIVAVQVDTTLGTGTLTKAKFVYAGESGVRGPQGIQGVIGPQGNQGLQGIQGVQGIQGGPGVQGATGIQGEPGIQGNQGLTGPAGTNGINGLVPAYGSFRDTTTQQVDFVSTPKAMTFNQITHGVNGVTANGVSVEFGSRITVARTGTYNVQFSAQLTKTDSGNDIMDIWLRRNGVDVPISNSEITITASQRQVATSNFIIDLTAGDYVEIMYSSADIATRILAIAPQTSPVRPAGPSVTVAITQVQ